jgi:hypothetical protein
VIYTLYIQSVKLQEVITMATKEVDIDIGGITVRVTSHSHNELHIPPIYERFITDSEPEAFLRVWDTDMPDRPLRKKLFESGRLSTYRNGEELIILFHTHDVYDTFPQRKMVVSRCRKTIDLYVCPSEGARHFHPLQRSLMKIIMTNVFSWGLGVMIHGCGVKDNGKGSIFAGYSGAGKSTMSRIWRNKGFTVLSEDIVALRKSEDTFLMYGTPWVKDFRLSSRETCSVNHIFCIEHAEKNTLTSKQGIAAITMIFPHVLSPLWDNEGMKFAMEVVSELAKRVPCYTLGFVPDEKVVDFARAVYR